MFFVRALVRLAFIRRLGFTLLSGFVVVGTTAFGSVTLQWQDNSNDESGFRIERSVAGAPYATLGTVSANVTTFTDSTIVAGKNHQYRVYAYNGAGNSDFSNTASFTAPAGNTAPTVGSISNRSIVANTSLGPITFAIADNQSAEADLTVTASSSNETLVPNSAITLGGAASSRTISITPAANQSGSATITLVVSDGNLSASTSFVLTVSPAPVTGGGGGGTTATVPTITAHPVSQTALTGNSVTFTVKATGTPAPTFQWRKDGSPISGATTAVLTLSNLQLSTSGAYDVVVTNSAGSVTSTPATLTVNEPAPKAVAPQITSQPLSQTALTGGTVTFTVTASGTPSPSFQWRKDGSPISSATTNVLTLSNLQLSASGVYDVVVANTAGSVTSTPATLTVNEPAPKAVAPQVTSQPLSQTALTGGTVTFTVTASGTPSPSFQWRKDGSPISGATTNVLTLSNLQLSASGAYDVVVANTAGSVTSTPAILTIDLPNFTGTYGGTFDGKGMWTLHVREDKSASYIAHLTHLGAAFVLEMTVEADGRLRVISSDVVELGGSAPKSSTSTKSSGRLAQNNTVALTGKIVGSTVTGTVPDLGVNFAGGIEAPSGPAASFAGFHAAIDESGDDAVVYVSIRSNGETVVVISIGDEVDWLVGVTTPEGSFGGVTNLGAQFQGSIVAGSLDLQATYTPARSTVTRHFKAATIASSSKLVNASIRTTAGTGNNTLITGFAVAGSTDKQILLRAIGPTLAAYGVGGTLADPTLTLYRNQAVAASNDNWASAGQDAINQANQRTGAFPLSPTSEDAVLLTTISPGAYSAHVSGKDAATGVSLIELYDADVAGDARVVNMSARCHIGTGDGVLILGFSIAGEGPKQLLIRGIGPSLAQYGVPGTLSDPQLTLYSGSTALDHNDNWGNQAQIKDAFGRTGAFPLDGTSKDAALLVTLEPGVYSVVLSGVSNATGVALLELYDVQ